MSDSTWCLSLFSLLALMCGSLLEGQSILYNHQGAGTYSSTYPCIGIGDVNKDGHDDYMFKSIMGGDNVTAFSGRTGDVLYTVPAIAQRVNFGNALASVPDVDGDKIRDVLVGASWASTAGKTSNGMVLLISGAPTPPGNRIIAMIPGFNSGDRFGYSVASAGDTNKDGKPDYIIGAIGYLGYNWGGAFVISGKDHKSLIHKYTGGAAREYYGTSVAGVGDVDGDGYADVAASTGPPGNGPSGYVKVYSSGKFGQMLNTFKPAGRKRIGTRMAMVGDVDRDGTSDLAFYAWNGLNAEMYVHNLKKQGKLILTVAGPQMGGALAGVGDVNGDGHADILTGSFEMRVHSGRTGGILYTLKGSTWAPGLTFGGVGAVVGDVNKDGKIDILTRANSGYGVWGLVISLTTLPLTTFTPAASCGTCSTHAISVKNGGRVPFNIDVGSKYAGKTYWVLGSATGHIPGFTAPWRGTHVPLNLDPYFDLTIALPNAPHLPGSFGTLDAAGKGTATLIGFPGMPANLIGITVWHAAVVLDFPNFTGLYLATNARPTTLVQ